MCAEERTRERERGARASEGEIQVFKVDARRIGRALRIAWEGKHILLGGEALADLAVAPPGGLFRPGGG